jgi:hypothetical protein
LVVSSSKPNEEERFCTYSTILAEYFLGTYAQKFPDRGISGQPIWFYSAGIHSYFNFLAIENLTV